MEYALRQNLTGKGIWKRHLETMLSKARKGINVLKITIKNPWGQNVKTLIHLAISLLRLFGSEELSEEIAKSRQ